MKSYPSACPFIRILKTWYYLLSQRRVRVSKNLSNTIWRDTWREGEKRKYSPEPVVT